MVSALWENLMCAHDRKKMRQKQTNNCLLKNDEHVKAVQHDGEKMTDVTFSEGQTMSCVAVWELMIMKEDFHYGR